MPTNWSPAELTDMLRTTWTSVADLCSPLDAAQWRTATDCPGWDVRAQVAHLTGTEGMLLGEATPSQPDEYPAHVRNDIGRFNEAWVAHLDDLDDDALLERFVEITDARTTALAARPAEEWEITGPSPVGDAPYRRFMEVRVFDCYAHEQDIRAALGRPGHDHGPALDRSVEEVAAFLGYTMGKRAGLAEGSSVRFVVGDRTFDVIVEGRARVTDAPLAAPQATVTIDPVTFVRLGCGRITPAGSDVGLAGDRALAEQAAAHLAFTM